MVVPAEPPILEPLVTDIRGRLGEDLVGLYLYGSAVTGGFDPGVSDVDLMAVTAREVENLDMAGLEAMHRDLLRHHPDWKDRIDVTYIEVPGGTHSSVVPPNFAAMFDFFDAHKKPAKTTSQQ